MSIQDMRANLPPPLADAWTAMTDKLNQYAADLNRKIAEYAETLPPGSMVAARMEVADPFTGVMLMRYTLAPVLPGQTPPPTPWVTYYKREETSLGYMAKEGG